MLPIKLALSPFVTYEVAFLEYNTNCCNRQTDFFVHYWRIFTWGVGRSRRIIKITKLGLLFLRRNFYYSSCFPILEEIRLQHCETKSNISHVCGMQTIYTSCQSSEYFSEFQSESTSHLPQSWLSLRFERIVSSVG